jgi:hypothetical protein
MVMVFMRCYSERTGMPLAEDAEHAEILCYLKNYAYHDSGLFFIILINKFIYNPGNTVFQQHCIKINQ